MNIQPKRRGPRRHPRIAGHRGFLLIALLALFSTAPARAVPATAPPAAPSVGPPGSSSKPSGPPTTPNIVLILTDDQRYDEVQHMPRIQADLVDRGVTFDNGFVVNPLCCPSRSTILTGRYSHGTDIYQNDPPHGGFQTFTTKGEDQSTIATLLHDAGYRTALVGKYLNGYTSSNAGYIPPGWDRWVASTAGLYYNYKLSVDGTELSYGSRDTDYSTDVLAGYAVNFIHSTPRSKPLFVYFAPHAPHLPDTPPARYRTGCQDLQPVRPPSYNEADVSDKPGYIRSIPPLADSKAQALDTQRLHNCQTLLAVDDAVGRILDELGKSGRLSNTLIVFTSDNGYLFGEHRWDAKVVPYEESIRVPMVARFDPLTSGHTGVSPRLVLNLDLAETFGAAAGLSVPGAEGASFLPLLSDPLAPWRSDFLIEHWSGKVPTYCGVRTEGNDVYVKYKSGDEELYDLTADPYELQNVASDPAYLELKQSLYQRMTQLCQPPPPGFTP